MTKRKKVFLHELSTLCHSSDYLTRCVGEFARANGFDVARTRDEADLIVVVGCNVRAENRATGEDYAGLAERRPDTKVVLAGCTPALPGLKKPGNLHVIPYGRLVRDPSRLGKALAAAEPFRFLPAGDILKGRVPFWLSQLVAPSRLCTIVVSQGCLDQCAFCAIRQAKGSVQSTPLEEALAELKAGRRRRCREFLLQSDDFGCWGADLGLDAAHLLERLAREAPAARFSFMTNPHHMLRLLPKLAPVLRQVRLIYMPIQSGSARILGLMRRPYDIRDVLALAARFRAANPEIILVTDVIAGFPTETREEFDETLRAARHFDGVIFNSMSVIPGTRAASLSPAVEPGETRRRLELARALGRRLASHELFDMSSLSFEVMASDRPMPVIWVAKGWPAGRGGKA